MFRKLFLLILSIASSIDSTKAFEIVDLTHYLNKPDMSVYGIQNGLILYGDRFWNTDDETYAYPEQAYIEAVRNAINDSDVKHVVIDIEVWEREIFSSIATTLYRRLALDLSNTRNDKVIGFYGVLPKRAYWEALETPGSGRHIEWTEHNTKSIPVSDAVDTLYPSLYTFYPDIDGWVEYARRNIAEARRIAPNKPIVPFLWPQYHTSNKELGAEFIDRLFWRTQLELMRTLADGVVIWGGWDFSENRQMQWDDPDWWQELVAFIEDSR